MNESLRQYYLSGGQIGEKPNADNSSSGQQDGKAIDPGTPPAQRVIDAGKEIEQVTSNYQALSDLLNRAMGGSEDALELVRKHFGSEPEEIDVVITKPLRDSQGREPEKFGMKIVETQQEMLALMADFDCVAAYFPGIELQNLPTTTKGKRLAVVIGVTAQDFNAVLAAERRRMNLEQKLNGLNKEIDKGRKQMGVDKTPRLPTGKDAKPVSATPSQGKPLLKSLTAGRTG